MTNTMSSLCVDLHLSTHYENEAQLKTLVAWCRENISQDVYFTGSHAEQYEDYFDLAKRFLDDFLPNASHSLANPVPAFDGLNTIQYAVKCGFHVFLQSQNIPLPLLNLPNNNLMTPVHISSALGYFKTTEILLAKGANPRIVNGQNQYPIYHALLLPIQYEEHLVEAKKKIFNLLLERTSQALTNHDKNGDNILHLMVVHDEFIELAQDLVAKAPTLPFTKNNGSRYPIHVSILNNQYKMSSLLLSIADVLGLEDGQSRNALHYAARYGRKELVELCISPSSEIIDKRDSEFKTPLLLAAEIGNKDAVECLISRGADVHAVDLDGFSILHHAVNSQNEELTRWLLKNTPHDLINLPDKKGHPPLFYARAHHNEGLESLLLEAGANSLPSFNI